MPIAFKPILHASAFSIPDVNVAKGKTILKGPSMTRKAVKIMLRLKPPVVLVLAGGVPLSGGTGDWAETSA